MNPTVIRLEVFHFFTVSASPDDLLSTTTAFFLIIVSVTRDISFTPHPDAERVLTPAAVDFLAQLHQGFDARRRELLAARDERQARFDAGERPDFLPETADVRDGEWPVPEAPKALADRRVEITGPVERKMMINALNSGAKVFMADFEDANSPTWDNVISGQVNLQDAVRGTIELVTPEKTYRLRRRDRHLGGPAPGLAPAREALHRRRRADLGQPVRLRPVRLPQRPGEPARAAFGPYFYLPKLEGHLEARLWNDVMLAAEDALGLERGSIRATVLIETITAAFEMDEILYELRDHICGLNAGRWDYIFSVAKRFHADPAFVLPDRSLVTMTSPFMRAYTELLVKTCHRRGAHAIGGMAAFIPNRRKPEVTEAALAKVTEDKRREAGDGFDGTWVAHPDLVATARAEFDAVLGDRPNQLERQRPEVEVGAARLLDVTRPPDGITRAGLDTNISVGLRYLASWLSGTGAAAIDDLMEDAATAEISRAQVWQWVHHGVTLADGTPVTAGSCPPAARRGGDPVGGRRGRRRTSCRQARAVFEQVALADDFPTFLTLPAYELLRLISGKDRNFP